MVSSRAPLGGGELQRGDVVVQERRDRLVVGLRAVELQVGEPDLLLEPDHLVEDPRLLGVVDLDLLRPGERLAAGGDRRLGDEQVRLVHPVVAEPVAELREALQRLGVLLPLLVEFALELRLEVRRGLDDGRREGGERRCGGGDRSVGREHRRAGVRQRDGVAQGVAAPPHPEAAAKLGELDRDLGARDAALRAELLGRGRPGGELLQEQRAAGTEDREPALGERVAALLDVDDAAADEAVERGRDDAGGDVAARGLADGILDLVDSGAPVREGLEHPLAGRGGADGRRLGFGLVVSAASSRRRWR